MRGERGCGFLQKFGEAGGKGPDLFFSVERDKAEDLVMRWSPPVMQMVHDHPGKILFVCTAVVGIGALAAVAHQRRQRAQYQQLGDGIF